MRKAIWACVVVACLATTGVYVASHHAERHPDSLLGRLAWAITPQRAPGYCSTTPCQTTPECTPAEPEHGPVAQAPRPYVEFFEPIIVVPGDAPEPPSPLALPTLQIPFYEEEAEVLPMPFADDDDVFMPYADGEELLPEPSVWHPDNDEFDGLLSAVQETPAGGFFGVGFDATFGQVACVVGDAGVSFHTLAGLVGLPTHLLHTTAHTIAKALQPATQAVGEEEAEAGATPRGDAGTPRVDDEECPEDAARRHHEYHHRMYCPYSGAPCPAVYRHMPATTPPPATQVGTTPLTSPPVAAPR